jgi:hypothetical protein
MQAIFWIFFCVLMPLVGINYASRMVFLSFLPTRISPRERPGAGARTPQYNADLQGSGSPSD